MPAISRTYLVSRPLVLVGIGDPAVDKGNLDFVVTWNMPPDDELFPLLAEWQVGTGKKEAETQVAALTRLIDKATCKQLGSDIDARDWLLTGNYPIRNACLQAFQRLMGGDLLQKN